MAAPERFAEMSDFSLAPRAPSIHGTTRTFRDVRAHSHFDPCETSAVLTNTSMGAAAEKCDGRVGV